jgi:hypothetical protein
MLSFFLHFLPMLGVGASSASAPKAHVEVISNPRIAQVRLAEALGTADSIDSVKSIRGERGAQAVFEVRVRGEALRLTASTRGGDMIASLVIAHAPGGTAVALGNLSWLADELRGATAVTTLAVTGGDVTIGTSDGRRYLILPGRGEGANDGVEARWAAAWSGN